LGHRITAVEVSPSLLDRLAAVDPDVIFNLATGYRSKRDQANIAAMLEISGIPFTGSGAHTHLLGLHKHLTKATMDVFGIPTPRYRIVQSEVRATADMLSGLDFPVIVKPASEGSSVGIGDDSVASDPESAIAKARDVGGRYGFPVLVEEFISGREFTIGLVGYPEPVALPVEEIVFKKSRMFTYDVKLRDAVEPVCPAQIPPECALELEDLAMRTFRAVGCSDVARVDIRVSTDGKPYVLEINTLPGLMPGYSEIPRMAERSGLPFRALVERILDGALMRRAA
jgi:D-alanine-D-alanine ligase